MTAAACYDRPISQDTIRRPSPSKPPLPILVRASKPGEQRLVPLSLAEHSDRSAPLDIALSWEQPVDPIAFTESLAKALSLFPCCAGRFVTREVSVEQAAGVTLKERRTCILCNNAGITFTHGHHNGKRPSVIGPMTGLFGRAAGTTTKADGCGGPLLRVKLVTCQDGQILALSFSQGLADVEAMGLFLQAWSKYHCGEEPCYSSHDARIALDGAVSNGFPKLDPSFTYLHRRELTTRESSAATAAAAAAERLGVATFLLKWEELNGLADSFSQQLRGRRLIYDSERLSYDEVAFALVVESLGRAVCASVWLDYGLTFGYDRLFGHVRGVADVDLPAVMKRKLQIARGSTDFWRWKAQQTKSCPVEPTAEIIFSSWLEAAELTKFAFTSGASPSGVGLGCSFWDWWMHTPEARRRAGGGGAVGANGQGCPSLVVLLPHEDGVQVQALLPQKAASKLCAKHKCFVYYP
ncbi:unnamed protein product [Durusdinium trenchii]|uniref:Uncharacterized protein n=1 Tax=Durusdinium trenchii TaxID=1381693 RepID=A0ABP0M1X1_9DINO